MPLFPENESKINCKLILYKMCQIKVVANGPPYNPTTAGHTHSVQWSMYCAVIVSVYTILGLVTALD